MIPISVSVAYGLLKVGNNCSKLFFSGRKLAWLLTILRNTAVTWLWPRSHLPTVLWEAPTTSSNVASPAHMDLIDEQPNPNSLCQSQHSFCCIPWGSLARSGLLGVRECLFSLTQDNLNLEPSNLKQWWEGGPRT